MPTKAILTGRQLVITIPERDLFPMADDGMIAVPLYLGTEPTPYDYVLVEFRDLAAHVLEVYHQSKAEIRAAVAANYYAPVRREIDPKTGRFVRRSSDAKP